MLNDLATVLRVPIENEHDIRLRQHVELMSDQNPRLSGQRAPEDAILQKMVTDVCIDGRKWIIKEDNLAGFIVCRSRQTNALSLTAGQGDTFLADLRSDRFSAILIQGLQVAIGPHVTFGS